jgi:hypothetical protein
MKVYDISDLMTRPLLLKLIIDVLLLAQIDIRDPNLSIGPSALYRLYIDAHLAIDWSKGTSRHFLTKEERLAFAKGMALAMLYGDGTLSVAYNDIINMIIKTLKAFPKDRRELLITQTEEVCTDVRVCSFLKLKGNNMFEFIHKSFMEYFIAEQIREHLYFKGFVDLLAVNLNHEILYFLGSFALVEADLRYLLLHQLKRDDQRSTSLYRRNVAGAILYSGKLVRGYTFENVLLDRLKFKKIIWEDGELAKVVFDGVIAEVIELENCRCKDVFLQECEIGNMNLILCVGEMTFNNTTLRALGITDNQRFTARFSKCNVEQLSADRPECLEIDAESAIGNLIVKSGRLVIVGGKEEGCEIARLHAEDCRIASGPGRDGLTSRKILSGRFARCKFLSFTLDWSDFKKMHFEKCTGVIYLAHVEEQDARFIKRFSFDKTVTKRNWFCLSGVLFVNLDRVRKTQMPAMEELLQLSDRLRDVDPSEHMIAEADNLFGIQ